MIDMAVILVIIFVLTSLWGDVAMSHPHSSYESQANNSAQLKSESIKRKGKDAFYGNAKGQAERDAIDLAHQRRLKSKTNGGFLVDLRHAVGDIMKRFGKR